MSTRYKNSQDIPNEVIAERLKELSCAVVARISNQTHIFDREFTCRIPAELDRDADLVLSEAARRLLNLPAWQLIETAPLYRRIRLYSSGLKLQFEDELNSDSDKELYTHWIDLPEDPI